MRQAQRGFPACRQVQAVLLVCILLSGQTKSGLLQTGRRERLDLSRSKWHSNLCLSRRRCIREDLAKWSLTVISFGALTLLLGLLVLMQKDRLQRRIQTHLHFWLPYGLNNTDTSSLVFPVHTHTRVFLSSESSDSGTQLQRDP